MRSLWRRVASPIPHDVQNEFLRRYLASRADSGGKSVRFGYIAPGAGAVLAAIQLS
jgi:hypothetical protein